MEIEDKIRKNVAANIKTTEPIDTYDVNGNLQNIGMDSITFIKIIVAIENEFGIEFPDEKLLVSETGTIQLLNEIVETLTE